MSDQKPPWTEFYEALHSSFITEVTAVQSKIKPELGLPVQIGRYLLPGQNIANVLMVPIELSGAQGLAFLASAFEASTSNPFELTSLWKRLFQQANKDFKKRKIAPKAGSPIGLKTANLPESVVQPHRMLWVPITLEQGMIYLGLGV